MQATKTANEIAALFIARLDFDSAPCFVETQSGYGSIRRYHLNLTQKQVDWLIGVWRRENRNLPKQASYEADARGFFQQGDLRIRWDAKKVRTNSGSLNVYVTSEKDYQETQVARTQEQAELERVTREFEAYKAALLATA